MQARILEIMQESINVKREASLTMGEGIERAALLLVEALAKGRKVMVCGNGGSAADAQHLAAEFVVRFTYDRPALAALALTTDTSILTAAGNDYDFGQIFARQVVALGQPGDVLIGISTSGNSPNVVAAAEAARLRGIKVIALTGAGGGSLAASADVLLSVPSRVTARIQEVHITVGHTLCDLVQEELKASEGSEQ